MNKQAVIDVVKKLLPSDALAGLRTLKNYSKRLSSTPVYREAVAEKKGIEIGGPSILFRSYLPIYPAVGSLDGVNFSGQTMWEGSIQSGRTFVYHRDRKGIQFISEATDLTGIDDNSYDFLLSSNCLEHTANPLKALKEWARVVRDNGSILLALPNKANNFDHRRPVTAFSHLMDDFNKNVGEDDLTHLEEIMALHDLSRDPPAGSIDQFRKRSLENVSNRGLHHHVFDHALMRQMLEFCGINVVREDTTAYDFIALGRIRKS